MTFTLWCFLLARGRFRPAATIAVCGMRIALLAGAPFEASSPFTQSAAMFYNRFGYALLALTILEGFQPGKFAFAGGVSTGVAIGLLLFLKINFFGASIPLLLLSVCCAPRNGRRVAGVAIGFFLIASGFLIWLRFDVSAMVNDSAHVAPSRDLRRFRCADLCGRWIVVPWACSSL